MVREIKFRAKYKDNNGWAYSNPNRMSVFWKDKEDGFFIDETIGQFSGLRDKNGREIYEGDFISIEYTGYAAYKNGELSIHKIEFLNGSLIIKPISGFWKLGAIDPSDVTVIGNIYENADLLEAK